MPRFTSYHVLLGSAALAACILAGPSGARAQTRAVPQLPPAAVQIVRQATSGAAEEKADAPGIAGVQSAPTDLYSHGNPTAEEQYILELINRARANPAAEGVRLAHPTDADLIATYNYLHVDTAKIRTDFAAYPVRPPLAFNSKLITASRLHSQDMSDNNFQGHDGSNGSTFDARINAQNYIGWSSLGENVFAYASSLLYAHSAFNVDWGNTDLGHRENIMNFKTTLFTEIGIGVVHDDRPSPHVGPIIVTEDFGNAKSPFLVGVVYEDKNNNGFYDVGEGIPNVTIMPSAGKYYAVTSESGGYALPYGLRGEVTVTASGAGLGGDMAKTVTVNNDNVKVDFIKGASSLPGIVALVAPAQGPAAITSATNGELLFTWRSVATATSYQIQIGTDSTFATGILRDVEMPDTSMRTNGLTDGTTYYWRVRAKNTSGWGAYSPHRMVRALAPLTAVTLLGPANGGTIQTNNTPFRWNHGAASVTAYGIELASDAQFATMVAHNDDVNDTLTTVSGLPAAQHLYWRVRPKNELGWGPYSEVWNVTTAVSSVNATPAGGMFHLAEAAPNPTLGTTQIRFQLARSGSVDVSITDALGRTVTTLAHGTLGAGSHELTWNADGLANGAYYCTLRSGADVQTIRLVLAR